MKTKIYLLRDPNTLEIRYIGQTDQELPERLVGHIHESYFRKRMQSLKKPEWVKSIFNTFNLPLIELIEIVDKELAGERERYWVNFYKDSYDLFNFMLNSNNKTSREDLRKKVYQYNKEGFFIKEWHSLLSVELELKIPAGNIIQSCKGKRKSGVGFMWRYYKTDKINIYMRDVLRKPIYQYDFLGNFIAEYCSARECKGFNYKNISQCCTGEKSSHKGFQWSFDKVDNIGEYSKRYGYKTKQYKL